jgi:hypothetical protein
LTNTPLEKKLFDQKALFDEVLSQFNLDGTLLTIERFSRGHLNSTYISTWQFVDTLPGISSDQGRVERQYIHQKVNTSIFKDPVALMQNIVQILDHINKKNVSTEGSLKLIEARSGKHFIEHEKHGFWRTYNYISDTVVFDFPPSLDIAYEGARISGLFDASLSDLDVSCFHVPILHFQDLEKRFTALDDAVKKNSSSRLNDVKGELQKAGEIRDEVVKLSRFMQRNRRRRLITHSDLKFNNLLFDARTHTGRCVVDLDTCMEGSLLYDFGDLVRSASVFCREDEQDLSKTEIQLDFFKALVEGFFSETQHLFNHEEAALFHLVPRYLAYTLGVRFLTDYLNGDVYFGAHYHEHNLHRVKTQFSIGDGMLRCENEMKAILQKYSDF